MTKQETIAQQLNIKTFPFRIEVDNNEVYYENSNGYWYKREYRDDNIVYYEDSDGDIEDNRPKSKAQVKVEQAPPKLETSYFTFGVSMKPVYRGEHIPSSSVIKITAENPREVMFSYFGDKWAFEYENFGKLSKYNTSGDIIEIFVVSDNVL